MALWDADAFVGVYGSRSCSCSRSRSLSDFGKKLRIANKKTSHPRHCLFTVPADTVEFHPPERRGEEGRRKNEGYEGHLPRGFIRERSSFLTGRCDLVIPALSPRPRTLGFFSLAYSHVPSIVESRASRSCEQEFLRPSNSTAIENYTGISFTRTQRSEDLCYVFRSGRKFVPCVYRVQNTVE